MIFYILAFIIFFFGIVVFFGAPYLPTHRKQVQIALDMLGIDEKSVLVDCGSGDGIMLLAAAKRGATVYGYELNPILCFVSWLRCRKYRNKVHIKLADFWKVPLPKETTAVYTFLLVRYMRKFDAKLQREVNARKKPLQLATYAFAVPGKQATAVKEGMFLYEYTPGRLR